MAEQVSENLGHLIGAGALDVKDQYVCVFVPSETRDLEPIDHDKWRLEAIKVMSTLFGGATAVESMGGWFDPDSMEVKSERVSLVFSMISSDEWNESTVSELRRFLHKLGREAKQGEVAILVMNQLLRIRRYDNEQTE